LLGFYESVINEDCQIYIDATKSQYFKIVSVYDIFSFTDIFVDVPLPNSTVVCGDKWRKAATRQYKAKLTAQQCAELFSYTDNFEKKLNKNITKLALPSKYQCFHVRRGDKVGDRFCRRTDKTGKHESKKYNIKDYLKRSDQSIKTVFIMSDDYSSILEAQQYDYDIKTLTTKDQTGHSTDLDTDNNRQYKEEELIQFFSEIEIAKQSQQFIGANSSNIFRYIKNQCVKNVEFISLD